MRAVIIERRRPDILHPHLHRALVLEIQSLCSLLGNVDHAGIDKRATIIDADHHLVAIFKIGHLHVARQRQGRVGGRQTVHVEPFAVRCLAPVKGFSIPGGQPLLVIVGLLLGREPAARNLIGLANMIAAAAPRHRAFTRINGAALPREGIAARLLAKWRATGQRNANGEKQQDVAGKLQHRTRSRFEAMATRANPVSQRTNCPSLGKCSVRKYG